MNTTKPNLWASDYEAFKLELADQQEKLDAYNIFNGLPVVDLARIAADKRAERRLAYTKYAHWAKPVSEFKSYLDRQRAENPTKIELE